MSILKRHKNLLINWWWKFIFIHFTQIESPNNKIITKNQLSNWILQLSYTLIECQRMTIRAVQLTLYLYEPLGLKLVTVSSSACSPEFSVDTVKSKCCTQPLESTGVKSKAVQPFKKRFGVCWTFLLLSRCCLLDRPFQKFSYALTTEISQSAVNWIHYATLKLYRIIWSQEWEKKTTTVSLQYYSSLSTLHYLQIKKLYSQFTRN